jgi:hypothetical protein
MRTASVPSSSIRVSDLFTGAQPSARAGRTDDIAHAAVRRPEDDVLKGFVSHRAR